jgi:hypothetical protein
MSYASSLGSSAENHLYHLQYISPNEVQPAPHDCSMHPGSSFSTLFHDTQGNQVYMKAVLLFRH